MHVLVTRPAADAETLKRPLEAMGHRVSVAPMLEVRLCGEGVSLEGVRALIATSRNALRAIEPALPGPASAALQLPLFAAGPGTAALAKALGFAHVIEGPGTAAGLAGVVAGSLKPGAGKLLHWAGDHKAFEMGAALSAAGFQVAEQIVYRSVASTSFPRQVKDDLAQGNIDAVILMSPRAAQTFVHLTDACGLAGAARGICYICLSETVAERLAVWRPPVVKIAESPNLDGILKVADQCQQSDR